MKRHKFPAVHAEDVAQLMHFGLAVTISEMAAAPGTEAEWMKRQNFPSLQEEDNDQLMQGVLISERTSVARAGCGLVG